MKFAVLALSLFAAPALATETPESALRQHGQGHGHHHHGNHHHGESETPKPVFRQFEHPRRHHQEGHGHAHNEGHKQKLRRSLSDVDPKSFIDGESHCYKTNRDLEMCCTQAYIDGFGFPEGTGCFMEDNSGSQYSCTELPHLSFSKGKYKDQFAFPGTRIHDTWAQSWAIWENPALEVDGAYNTDEGYNDYKFETTEKEQYGLRTITMETTPEKPWQHIELQAANNWIAYQADFEIAAVIIRGEHHALSPPWGNTPMMIWMPTSDGLPDYPANADGQTAPKGYLPETVEFCYGKLPTSDNDEPEPEPEPQPGPAEDDDDDEDEPEPEPQPQPGPAEDDDEPSPETDDTAETDDTPEPPKPPTPAVTGDPHFVMWSGHKFDFHGGCDLVLLKDPSFNNGQGLRIHIRTKIVRWWSFVDSAAVQIGSDTLEVMGGVDTSRGYFVNGQPGPKLGKASMMPFTIGGYSVRHRFLGDHQFQFKIFLENGQNIVLKAVKEFMRVDVENPTVESFGKSAGLMGSFEGGEMFGRDGHTVFYDPVAFGKEWQVHHTEPMLFHNEEGVQHPDTCAMPDHSQATDHRRLAGSMDREQAEIACINANPEQMEDCIFDVMATNDVDMAGAY